MNRNVKPWQRPSDHTPRLRWRPAPAMPTEPTYKFILVGERNPVRKCVVSGHQWVNKKRREAGR